VPAALSAAGTALLSAAKARTPLPRLRVLSLPLQAAVPAALSAAGTALLSAAKARTPLPCLRVLSLSLQTAVRSRAVRPFPDFAHPWDGLLP